MKKPTTTDAIRIIEHLASKPYINVSALEQHLSLPASTIAQALGGTRTIPAKHLAVIKKELCID